MSPTTAAQQLQNISEHQNSFTTQKSYTSSQQSSVNVNGQQPIHFDQALGYLNKIKVFIYFIFN